MRSMVERLAKGSACGFESRRVNDIAISGYRRLELERTAMSDAFGTFTEIIFWAWLGAMAVASLVAS